MLQRTPSTNFSCKVMVQLHAVYVACPCPGLLSIFPLSNITCHEKLANHEFMKSNLQFHNFFSIKIHQLCVVRQASPVHINRH